MITGQPNQQVVQSLKLGTVTDLYIPIDDATQTYEAVIYAIDAQKYLDTEFKYVDSPVNVPLTVVTAVPPSLADYAVLKLSTYYLTRPDMLNIQVTNTNDPTDTISFLVKVGEVPALAADTILVYGYLYNTYGEPIRHEPVTFTVLNSASYFDNAPITRLNATTLTDESGRFEIPINRRYDYVFSVSRLNYTKLLKISEVPDNVLTLEVVIGRGLVCD